MKLLFFIVSIILIFEKPVFAKLEVNWNKKAKFSNKKLMPTNKQKYIEIYYLKTSDQGWGNKTGNFIHYGLRNISNQFIGSADFTIYISDKNNQLYDKFAVSIMGLEANNFCNISNANSINEKTRKFLDENLKDARFFVDVSQIKIADPNTFKTLKKIKFKISRKNSNNSLNSQKTKIDIHSKKIDQEKREKTHQAEKVNSSIDSFLFGYWNIFKKKNKKWGKNLTVEIIPKGKNSYLLKIWGKGSIACCGKFKLEGNLLKNNSTTWKLYPGKGLKVIKGSKYSKGYYLLRKKFSPSNKRIASILPGQWRINNNKWKIKNWKIEEISPLTYKNRKYRKFIFRTHVYVLSGDKLMVVGCKDENDSFAQFTNWKFDSKNKLIFYSGNYGQGNIFSKISK